MLVDRCCVVLYLFVFFFFFQAEDGIRDYKVTGVQTCALPIYREHVTLREPHVGPCVQPLARDPIGAAVRKGGRVGWTVRADGVLVVVAAPGGGKAAFDTSRNNAADVEPQRRAAIELVLIVAHQVAAAVGWEMVERIAVAERQRGVRTVVGA